MSQDAWFDDLMGKVGSVLAKVKEGAGVYDVMTAEQPGGISTTPATTQPAQSTGVDASQASGAETNLVFAGIALVLLVLLFKR